MRSFLHLFLTLAFQIIIGLLTGDFLIGGAFAVGAFFGRETRQAQELYSQRTGKALNEFDFARLLSPKAWTFDSFIMDLCVPALGAVLLYRAVTLS